MVIKMVYCQSTSQLFIYLCWSVTYNSKIKYTKNTKKYLLVMWQNWKYFRGYGTIFQITANCIYLLSWVTENSLSVVMKSGATHIVVSKFHHFLCCYTCDSNSTSWFVTGLKSDTFFIVSTNGNCRDDKGCFFFLSAVEICHFIIYLLTFFPPSDI